ncbi:MAG: hypothetical protein EOO17_02075 [Chloroflexi bacterium]|nr:MAG: hypothetical protein EOO17_02075 [Chloroflexota bacterium]
MYTLKSIARRSVTLGAAFAIVASTIVPAASVFADELNPLTERSLLLSSSAPGFQDTDGSGNSTANPSADPNNGTYAPAGSGPNGKKTGQTFSFRVSSDSTVAGNEVKAMTFQYCTKAAGLCRSPGNNVGVPDTTTTSDLNVNYTSPVAGTDFQVFQGSTDVTTGWTMESVNKEDPGFVGAALTGKKNYITLKNTTGIDPAFNEQLRIVFKASETNHITNPGAGSFFVKINTYKSDSDVTAANIIDGGVTVANVMTDSIHITTKVLETMSFSVGTKNRDTVILDPDTQNPNNITHGTCDPILQENGNQLQLGDTDAEFSLDTRQAYDANSYWRLSSNSSGGATVYYSGNTLANTVGDEIAEIGETKEVNQVGTEQFGLAFVDAGDDTIDPALTTLQQQPNSRYRPVSAFPFTTLIDDPVVSPIQTASINYNEGEGTLASGSTPGTAKFAFQKSSSTVPVAIAQQNEQVISCSTAKMRYVANIGADTPAGVYTTKINYLAAPQY